MPLRLETPPKTDPHLRENNQLAWSDPVLHNVSQSTAEAMDRISQISEGNSARLHEINAATKSFQDTAARLNQQVDQFRLG
jgi:methyl-accepting chemotaxis protein